MDRAIGTNILPVFAMLAEPFTTFVKPEYIPGDIIRKDLDEEKVKAQIAREPDEERGTYREMQAVADELGVRVDDLMKACEALWGEYVISPSSERERRLLASGADLSNPTSVRTVRGHITRQLMAELRDYFASHPHEQEPSNG
jgi:hypothetical protein